MATASEYVPKVRHIVASISVARSESHTVDLAIGSRWWLLLALAPLPFVGISVFGVHPSNASSRFASAVLEAAVLGGASQIVGYSAAVLLSPGSSPRHILASVAIILGSAAAMTTHDGRDEFFQWVLWFGVLSLVHVSTIRLLAWPRWRVRPSRRRRRGVSIAFLLGLTAAVAAAAAVVRAFEFGELAKIMSGMLLQTLASALVGQFGGAYRNRQVSLAVGVCLWVAVMLLAAVPHNPLWATFKVHSLGELYCTSVAASTWTLCFFHRLDPASIARRPTLPTAGPPSV